MIWRVSASHDGAFPLSLQKEVSSAKGSWRVAALLKPYQKLGNVPEAPETRSVLSGLGLDFFEASPAAAERSETTPPKRVCGFQQSS